MSTPTCKHDWHFVQGLTERLRCTRCGLMTWPKDYDERVQEMLTDALVTGTGMLRVSSEGVERIDPSKIFHKDVEGEQDMKPAAEHCVFQHNQLVCLRCQGTFTLPLPMDIDELAKKTRAFIALHKDCKEPNHG